MTTTMNLIAKQTVGASGAANITFSNIPQTFTDLLIKVSARSTEADNASSLRCYFNGDTGNITVTELRGINSTIASYSASYAQAGYVAAAQSTANTFGSADIYVPNYTSSNVKSSSGEIVQASNTAGENYAVISARKWNSNSAITSVTLSTASSPWVEYSEFWLYGVSNSTTQATTVPYASGGDVITTDGTYWYHAFKYSGSFTPLKNLTADVLVVAGGGGGGYNTGGGGGAGGLRTFTTQALTSAINYTCTIGAGGAGGIAGGSSDYRGINGSNSSFAGSGFTTINASGGGGGGTSSTSPYSTYAVGRSGGSGGGASRGGVGSYNGATGNSGGYSPVEGYNGGANGPLSPGGNSGGGGGAGAVGVDATANQSGAGGIGATSSLINAMATATATGILSSGNYYYAGGGGGGSYTGSAGAGGIGGGGAGSPDNNAGVTGSANTGGGGGGGNNNNNPTGAANGYAGGSGIIVLRYAV